MKHADEMRRDLLKYVGLGWQIVPIWGIQPDGRCGCGQAHAGSAESAKGKHPILTAWQTRPLTTEEAVNDAVDQWPGMNAGVLLGPASGIVDIEFDDERGRETAARLGLAEIVTPTYRSGKGGRSVHRLFRWNDRLPAVAVRKVDGLECRLGGDSRGAQSILPPSRYWAGGRYQWLDGLSPDEVEVAEIPEALMAAILSGSARVVAVGGDDDRALHHGETLYRERSPDEVHGRSIIERASIGEGERNDALFRGACRIARVTAGLDRADIQADFIEVVRALNIAKCRPPLELDEVDRIAAGAINYATRTPGTATTMPAAAVPLGSAAMVNGQINGHGAALAQAPAAAALDGSVAALDTKSGPGQGEAAEAILVASGAILAGVPQTWLDHGLSCSGGVYGPGNWTLTVVDSDPPIYRLHVPAWVEWTPDRTGDVSVTHEVLSSPAALANAILSATRVIYLAGPDWKGLWLGNKKQPSLLRALLASHYREAAPIEMQVWASPAEYLLRQIDSAPTQDIPDETGSPVWIDDVCWLVWGSVFDLPVQQGRFTAGKVQELFGKLGMMRRSRRIWPEAGEHRRRYYGFGRDCVANLRALILG